MTLPGGQTIQPPSSLPKGGLTFLQGVIKNGLTIFLTIVVVLCIIVIVYSGLQWASSSGDKNKIAQARSRMTWAIIGMIIALMSFFIAGFIGAMFGVKLF